MSIKELWEIASRDLQRPAQLQDLLNGLALANKAQMTPLGWLAKKTPPRKVEFVDFTMLTAEERMMLNG